MEKIVHFIATCPNMDDGCYQLRNWSHSNINSSHCNCQIKGGHLARRQRLFFTKKGAELGRQLCIHKWSMPSLPEILKATTKSAFIIYARIRRRHKRFKGHTALIRARNTPQAQNISSKAALDWPCRLEWGRTTDDGIGGMIVKRWKLEPNGEWNSPLPGCPMTLWIRRKLHERPPSYTFLNVPYLDFSFASI